MLNRVNRSTFLLPIAVVLLLGGCSGNDPVPHKVTPYEIKYPEILSKFLPALTIPGDNPMTEEGVMLGRKLFFEKQLSADGTMSCATCHIPEKSFAENTMVSTGIDGIEGPRNAQNIINAGWMLRLFWDGAANGLEDQVFFPVRNPVEMHETWINVATKLSADEEYVALFAKAFGDIPIDSTLVVKAIAQFERTLLSGNSPFDKYLLGNPTNWSNEDMNAAIRGFDLFMAEDKGDCFHCHGSSTNPLWTDNFFHNNGLDETHADEGLAKLTSSPADIGKFKTPTLRNLLFSAPYMHDGRFETLEEVINHYSEGLVNSPTIDPLMKQVNNGGVNLTEDEKADLLMFLKSLTDSSFIENPDFQDPG